MKKTTVSLFAVFCFLLLLLVPSFADGMLTGGDVTSGNPTGDDLTSGEEELTEEQRYLRQLRTAPVSTMPESDQTKTVITDKTKDYALRFCDGVLVGRYTQTLGEELVSKQKTTGSTELKLEDGQFGFCRTVVFAINGEYSVMGSEWCVTAEDCGNRLSSGEAVVSEVFAAKQIVHYGWRATSSWDIAQYWIFSE